MLNQKRRLISYLLQHEDKLNGFLKQVKSYVKMDLYKHLHPQHSQPGIMYGLSKIHKTLVNDFPKLRPILSAMLVLTNGQNILFLCSNHLLLTIIQLRTPLISPKTLLNKVPNYLWLPLMWIPFSQTCHLMTLLKYVLTRSSHQRCSIKMVFLEISQNSQEYTCARASFVIKQQGSGLQRY